MKNLTLGLLMAIMTLSFYSCREATEEGRESGAEQVDRRDEDTQQQDATETEDPMQEVEEQTEQTTDDF